MAIRGLHGLPGMQMGPTSEFLLQGEKFRPELVGLVAHLLLEKTFFHSVSLPLDTLVSLANDVLNKVSRESPPVCVSMWTEAVVKWKLWRGRPLSEEEQAYWDIPFTSKKIDVLGEVVNGLHMSWMASAVSGCYCALQQGLGSHLPWIGASIGVKVAGYRGVPWAVSQVLEQTPYSEAEKTSLRPWLTMIGRLALGMLPRAHATSEGVHYQYPSTQGWAQTYSANQTISFQGEVASFERAGTACTPEGCFDGTYAADFRLRRIYELSEERIRIQVTPDKPDAWVEFRKVQGVYGPEITVYSDNEQLKQHWGEFFRPSNHSIAVPSIPKSIYNHSDPTLANGPFSTVPSDAIPGTRLYQLLRAIHEEPREGKSYHDLGYALSDRESVQLLNGETVTEQDLYLKAILYSPSHGEAYNNLAGTLSEGASIRLLNGTTMTRQQLYLQAIDLSPDLVDLYDNLATTLSAGESIRLLNGNTMTRETLYLTILHLDPNHAVTYNNLGNSLPSGGSVTLFNGVSLSKQELFLKSIDLDPTNSAVYYNLGLTLVGENPIQLLNGHLMTASQLFLKAIDLNPHFSEAYYDLGFRVPRHGSVQLLNKVFMNKKNLYLKAIECNPNLAVAYLNLGAILPSSGSVILPDGRSMNQRRLYLKAIDLDATLARGYHNLAHLLPQGHSVKLLNGTPMSRQDLFLKAIDLDPHIANAYVSLGDILSSNTPIKLLNGVSMSRQDLYLKTIELDPRHSGAHHNLAGTLLGTESIRLPDGQVATPLELLLKAIDLNPNVPHYYRNLGSILRRGAPPITLLNGTQMTREQLINM